MKIFKSKWECTKRFSGIIVVALLCAPAWSESSDGGIDEFGLSQGVPIDAASNESVLPRLEIEALVAEILQRTGERDGVVMSETSAFFEGCVLVKRLNRFKERCSYAGYWQRDDRIDLRYLITHPSSVETQPPSDNPRFTFLGARVKYEFEPDISDRLRILYRQYRRIGDAEINRYPADVELRLQVIADRIENELLDQVYLDAGKKTSYCSGLETSAPIDGDNLIFFVDPLRADEFVDLIHMYSSRYCSPGSV